MNIIKHKKTILIIIVILMSFFGYWYFHLSKKNIGTEGGSNSSSLRTKVPVSSTPLDKEFVSSLISLRPVSLDTSIFNSEVYKALNYPEIPFVLNYSTDSGRPNPFLPIGINPEFVESDASTQNRVNNTVNTSSVSSTSTRAVPTTLRNETNTLQPVSTSTPTPKRF